MLGIVQKRPGDRLDYDIDFSRWLSPNDRITSAAAVSSAPDVMPVDAIQFTGQAMKVWISGGALQTSYDVTVTAHTLDGRIKQEAFEVRIRN